MTPVRRTREGHPGPDLDIDQGEKFHWVLELDVVLRSPAVPPSQSTARMTGWMGLEFDSAYWQSRNVGLQCGVWFEVGGVPADVDPA